MIKASVTGLFLFFVMCEYAHAQSCKEDTAKAQTQEKLAQPISEKAKATEAAAVSGASSQVGDNINSNTGVGGTTAAICSAGYAGAAKELAALLPTCEVKCVPNPPPPGEDVLHCEECTAARESCKKTVEFNQAQVASGQQGCAQLKEGTDITGMASKAGQMLPALMGLAGKMMGKKGGGGGDTASGMPQMTTALAADCSKENSYMNPDCNEKTLVDCAGNGVGSEKCESFGFRYCNPESAGGTGEGIGTDTCKKRMAKQFCLNENNSKCPSCKQQMVEQAEYCQDKSRPCVEQSLAQQVEEAKASCPSDPILADPKVALTPPPNSGFSMASAGAGGGGEMAALKNKVVEEDKRNKGDKFKTSVGSTEVDGGGGGGYSYGGGGGPYDSDLYNFKLKSASLLAGSVPGARTPSSAAGGFPMLTPEVSASKSLFTMSTEAIKSRCVRGMLSRCGP